MSFLIFLNMLFLMHLCSTSGRNATLAKLANASEEGYQSIQADYQDTDFGNGAEAPADSFELDVIHDREFGERPEGSRLSF